MSVFFGLTPAAGPGFVVAQIARAAVHCVTGIEWQDEAFGRLDREHLIGGSGHSLSGCHRRQPSSA
jgi:hypothetical protein